MMSVKLQEPITAGGLPNTNFFNGRLVTGADLTREQNARREAVERVGRAAGEGIVDGLEVETVSAAPENPVLGITAGMAVNRCGQVLLLTENTAVDLLQRIGAHEQAASVFSACQPLAGGTYAAGFGLYLLVLSPVNTKQGSAPAGGLKNTFAACGTDVILEAVQFRLLAIDAFFTEDDLSEPQKLRNFVAYRCFGISKLHEMFLDPLLFAEKEYGLLDEMRGKTLTDSDVPLAIINWTAQGIEFVEMHAVRRRLVTPNSADWTQLFGGRRLAETEAMIRQFVAQINDSEPEKNDYRRIKARDYFYFLPPVGMIPAATAEFPKGFDWEFFFDPAATRDAAFLDGESLQPLLREAAGHEPIILAGGEKIQLYFINENYAAYQAGLVDQVTVIFAKRTIPFYGTARFDAAQWNASRFA